jgi:hypothetical protein
VCNRVEAIRGKKYSRTPLIQYENEIKYVLRPTQLYSILLLFDYFLLVSASIGHHHEVNT